MSALILKIIACLCMLLDHIGYLYDVTILRIIGRLSFPIYLFLIYNGFQHTSNPLRYAIRLGIFAVISQIPFSLCFYNTVWCSTGNVMFTLLAALLCLWLATWMRQFHWLKEAGCLIPFILMFLVFKKHIIWTEYADKAMLMMMVLFLCGKGTGIHKVLTGVGLAVAMNYSHLLAIGKNLLCANGQILPDLSRWELIQLAAVCAIPLILLYNGEKGTFAGGKVAVKVQQYGFYLFYPLHILILWLINML